MKVLFLDVDGVLNDFTLASDTLYALHDEKMSLVRRIVQDTDCKIVISSTWRLYPECMDRLRDKFADYDIVDSVIAVTPQIGFSISKRHLEIQEVIDKLKKESSGDFQYAVLDDMISAGFDHGDNFFQTNPKFGLTTHLADAIIEHLNGKSETE